MPRMVTWATLFCHCEPWRDNSSVTHSRRYLGVEAPALQSGSVSKLGKEGQHQFMKAKHLLQLWSIIHCMNGTSRGIQPSVNKWKLGRLYKAEIQNVQCQVSSIPFQSHLGNQMIEIDWLRYVKFRRTNLPTLNQKEKYKSQEQEST